jgi:sugar phosphate isomerase/epimerase
MVRLMTRAAGMPTGSGGKLDWHALLNESGLSVVSLHTDLGSLEREAEAVAEEARSYGTDTVVITGMYRFDYSDEATVRELAQRLNRAGETLRGQGLRLLYHNHNVELLPVRPGLRAYELLLDETDENAVNFEFDSYWFTDGGADAKVWMQRLGRRMKLWHINDRGSRQKGPAMTPILKADSMELGTGNMNLDALREIALSNGIEAVVLESHRNWIDKDPVKSLELSAKWLNGRF